MKFLPEYLELFLLEGGPLTQALTEILTLTTHLHQLNGSLLVLEDVWKMTDVIEFETCFNWKPQISTNVPFVVQDIAFSPSGSILSSLIELT